MENKYEKLMSTLTTVFICIAVASLSVNINNHKERMLKTNELIEITKQDIESRKIVIKLLEIYNGK